MTTNPVYTLMIIGLFIVAFTVTAGDCFAQTLKEKRSVAQVNRQWKKTGWEFDKGWKAVVDDSAAEAWGKAFEKAIAEKDLNSAIQLVDFKSAAERCGNGITNEQFRAGFKQGVSQGMVNTMKVLATPHSKYRFVGVRQTEYGSSALMRFLDPTGGCNFHLWQLQTNEAGKTVGVDMYIFVTGESFGDTMRRLAVLSVPADDRSFFQKLVGSERSIGEHQKKVLAVIQSAQQKNFPGVLKSYDALPNDLKKEKFFLIARMSAAMQVNMDEYIKTLETYQKEYPGDASADLASIDLYFLKEDFKNMFAALDRLDAAVGKDSHLLMLRAVGLMGQDDMDDATKTIDEAIKLEPELESSYWTKVQIALKKGDMDAVTDTLITLSKTFGYNQFELEGNEMYKTYIGTEQHKKFQEFLKTIDK